MSAEWISHLHLSTFILIAAYGFVFSKNAFDPFYLVITYITVTQWTFFNGECLISFIYKRINDPSYVAGTNIDTNEFETTYGIPNQIMQIIILVQSMLWIASMHIVLKRNQFPLSMSISFVSIFVLYFILRLLIKDPCHSEPFLIIQEIIKYALLIYGIILLYGLYKRVFR